MVGSAVDVGESAAIDAVIGPEDVGAIVEPRSDGPVPSGPGLEAIGLMINNDHGVRLFDGFDLDVPGGQIVGVAGVAGNGQVELADALAGVRMTDGGAIALNGVDLTGRTTAVPMVYTGTFTEGMVGGRGWLVIALAFLGGWRPQYVIAGAAFFAGMEVLALRAQVAGIGIPHQFVLILPYVATLVVMMFAFRRARQPKYLGLNYDRESRLSG